MNWFKNFFKRNAVIPKGYHFHPTARQLTVRELEVDNVPDDSPPWAGQGPHFLFEYGETLTVKKPFKSDPICTVFTVETFSLWYEKQTGPRLPKAIALKINFLNPDTARMAVRAKIRGELYACKPTDLNDLDKERHAGLQFERRRVNVMTDVCDLNGKPFRVAAWVYVGKDIYWKHPILFNENFYPSFRDAAFGIVQTYDDLKRPWISKYYHFTALEFERPHEFTFFDSNSK